MEGSQTLSVLALPSKVWGNFKAFSMPMDRGTRRPMFCSLVRVKLEYELLIVEVEDILEQ